MAESVYKVIELVGTSSDSWEKAAAAAVERSQGCRDRRAGHAAQEREGRCLSGEGESVLQVRGRQVSGFGVP